MSDRGAKDFSVAELDLSFKVRSRRLHAHVAMLSEIGLRGSNVAGDLTRWLVRDEVRRDGGQSEKKRESRPHVQPQMPHWHGVSRWGSHYWETRMTLRGLNSNGF